MNTENSMEIWEYRIRDGTNTLKVRVRTRNEEYLHKFDEMRENGLSSLLSTGGAGRTEDGYLFFPNSRDSAEKISNIIRDYIFETGTNGIILERINDF